MVRLLYLNIQRQEIQIDLAGLEQSLPGLSFPGNGEIYQPNNVEILRPLPWNTHE